MGEVRVPGDAKWQAQTQRAVENFPISGMPIERALIAALAVDQGCRGRRQRPPEGHPQGRRRRHRGRGRPRWPAGGWDDHFPVDVFQTGSGTSSNMNMNEVLATLAVSGSGAPVHPNDHVNASQSSNDVFPSAIHLAATREITVELIPALEHLAKALRRKQRAFRPVVKAGRTHLMDATPVTLGQEFGGYARRQVEHGIERLRDALPRVGELPLGGTAVGTGINAPKGFARAVISEAGRPTPGCRSPRPATTSRPRGRATRSSRPAGCLPRRGRQPEQDRLRPPLDVVGAPHRPGRDPPARPAARARRSCRAR